MWLRVSPYRKSLTRFGRDAAPEGLRDPGVHADELYMYIHYNQEKHGIAPILEALHMAAVQRRPDTPTKMTVAERSK